LGIIETILSGDENTAANLDASWVS